MEVVLKIIGFINIDNNVNNHYFEGITDEIWKELTATKDCDKFSEEFLSTPDAARNFKVFPRFSAYRNFNFDPLSNGTAKAKRNLKLSHMLTKRSKLVQVIDVTPFNEIYSKSYPTYVYKFKNANEDIYESVISFEKDEFNENSFNIYLYKGYANDEDLIILNRKVNELKTKYKQDGFKVNVKIYSCLPDWFENGEYL